MSSSSPGRPRSLKRLSQKRTVAPHRPILAAIPGALRPPTACWIICARRTSPAPSFCERVIRASLGASSSLNARTRRVIATSPARTGAPCNAPDPEKSHPTCRMHHLVVHPLNRLRLLGLMLLRGHGDWLWSGTMTLRVRELNDHERVEVQRIARSHTLGAALVRRAQIVVHAMDGLKAEEIATRMDLCGNTVRHWLNRFNARGLDGLKEDVRTGRPPTYSAEQRSAVITAALTRPSELGLPFASWTLDRLVSYLSEQGIAMRRSRISEIFIRQGLRWRQEETWFGARVDPDFAKKRGRSNSSTRRRRQAVYSSAW